MNKEYYQWRINYVIHNSVDFREWLIYKDAEIFAGKGLTKGEVFKFRINGGIGILYETGKCNTFFNKIARVFKNANQRRKTTPLQQGEKSTGFKEV